MAGARLVVVEAGPMVAGANDGEQVRGGRSSVKLRVDIAVHGRAS